jgi:hypothetical protein
MLRIVSWSWGATKMNKRGLSRNFKCSNNTRPLKEQVCEFACLFFVFQGFAYLVFVKYPIKWSQLLSIINKKDTYLRQIVTLLLFQGSKTQFLQASFSQ